MSVSPYTDAPSSYALASSSVKRLARHNVLNENRHSSSNHLLFRSCASFPSRILPQASAAPLHDPVRRRLFFLTCGETYARRSRAPSTEDTKSHHGSRR
jgi:hypothetical protein